MSSEEQTTAGAPAPNGGASPSATDRIEPYVWKIAGVVILGMTMSILDTTIVNVAIDTLARELDSTLAQIQWVATGYLLALAAVIPLTGWAARRFGAKRVYLASIGLFTLGSALCGVAESSTTLILFRVLQGIGGGMIMPVAQMIMAEVAGPKRMGRVMGIVVMPAMLAPILGPVVGGLILQNLHWSWIFFVNVPIGIVAAILGMRMLPDSDLGEAGKLDWLGLGLLATSMPLVVYGLSEIATKESFTAPTVVWPIVGGLLLAAVFGRHALRASRPLLDVRLYANRIFAAASLTTFGLGAALFGAMILVPLYYQQVRGESVIVTGLLTGPQGLGMLLVAPWIARMTERFGGGRVAFVGVSILTLSSLPLAFIGPETSILFISLTLLVRGVGIGLSFIPVTTVAFASLRTDQLSDATPQMNVLQRVGGAIGTAVLAVVLQRASAGAHNPTELADAFGTAYWWALGICAASIIPVLVLLRAEGPHQAPPTPAEAKEIEIAEEFVESLGAELASGKGAPGKPAEPDDRQEAITELGIAFRTAFRRLRSMRGRDTHRGDEIGHAQFELLTSFCIRGPLHAGELAEVVGASAATVSGMLDNLCAAELVERSRSESDRRLVVVKLTRRGKRKVEARKALWRRRWEEALEGLDEDELRVAGRVLDRIGDIFTERPED